MSKKFIHNLLAGCIILTLLFAATGASAAESVKRDRNGAPHKVATNDVYRVFSINNLFNYYSNTGDGSINPNTGQSGFEFPKGSKKFCTFEDGIVWGGFHKGRKTVNDVGDSVLTAKVGGSTYSRGLQAGAILTAGGSGETDVPVADDASLAKYRTYVVRPDVTPTTPFSSVEGKLEAEAALISRYDVVSAQTLYNDYIQDWNEWPAKDGLPAPFKDVDGDGVYNPAVDVPGQPGADQTLYYVANDCNNTTVTDLYGSPTIGLEMHRTIWGYNQSGALGNTVFESTLLINKSGAPLDSTFLVQWSDVDNGDANDDYSGCDVPRALGYTYNGKAIDDTYGVEVPAVGYTFFQGPILSTGNQADSAVFRLKVRHGYKNMGMTAFVFFINSSTIYKDPDFGTGGDIQWYYLMNGLISGTGAPFINPLTKQAVKYTLDGDPVAGTGWIDGTFGLIPGDRRQCSVTGPFTLANGDTQEVVVAHVVGLGSDRISSVAVLKWYSDLAQSAYNLLFNIPFPPPAPKLDAVALDQEIALNWVDTTGIEKWNSGGYAFEGYNVYQFPDPSADITKGIRLTTYDLVDAVTTIFDDVYDPSTGYIISKPVEFGKDSGIRRTFSTKTDAVTGRPLANGNPYYFGVTSYSFKSGSIPTHLESAPDLYVITPHAPNPGTRYPNGYGDTLAVTHTVTSGGASDGILTAIVVDPQLLTGATYQATFTTVGGGTVWNLLRTLGGRVDTVAKNQTDQSGDISKMVLVDGILFGMTGAPNDFKTFLVTANANGPLNPPQAGAFGFNTSNFPLGPPLPPGTDRPDGTIQQSTGLTAAKGWGIHTGMTSSTMSLTYANFVTRVTNSGARWPLIVPYDFEIRFTAAGGEALFPSAFTGLTDVLVHVPFELWNIGINTPNDPSDDYRMFPNILDVDGNNQFNLLTQAGVDVMDNGTGETPGVATHSISGGANDPFTDWIYWALPTDKSPGQAGYNAIVAGAQAAITGGSDPYLGDGTDGIDVLRRLVLVGWNFGSVATGTYPQQMPETGTVFRIVSTKPNGLFDVFTLVAPKTTQTNDLAKSDVGNINVFPNPYVGFNPLERDKYSRFVTFSHLPTKATIRIFNLAGVLVRTIMKNGASQFQNWDLKNESGFPVAAGMYIVYVDMPEIGATKTIKLGLIPEQQFIDRW